MADTTTPRNMARAAVELLLIFIAGGVAFLTGFAAIGFALGLLRWAFLTGLRLAP